MYGNTLDVLKHTFLSEQKQHLCKRLEFCQKSIIQNEKSINCARLLNSSVGIIDF